MSGGRILDNQMKWRKLGYKGDTTQSIKKSDSLLTGSDFNTVKKVGEIRRTSDSDINKSAIEKESSLLTEAIKHNIMLVSPTTLLIALRTINNLWRYENQNYHAKKIADKAGRLYDKLRLFTEDLNKIGQHLNKAEMIYKSAKNKFSEGKGNIISQIESFRTLGVQIKQPITSDATEPKSTLSLINENKNTIYPNNLKNSDI